MEAALFGLGRFIPSAGRHVARYVEGDVEGAAARQHDDSTRDDYGLHSASSAACISASVTHSAPGARHFSTSTWPFGTRIIDVRASPQKSIMSPTPAATSAALLSRLSRLKTSSRTVPRVP